MEFITTILYIPLYFIITFYFIKIVNNFVEVKDNKIIKILAIIAMYCVPNVIIYTSDIVNISYTMIGFILQMILFYKGSYIKKISVVLILYPTVVGLNLLSKDLITDLYVYLTTHYKETIWLDPFLVIMELAIVAYIWFLIYTFSKDKLENINRYIDTKIWIMIDIICLAPFISIIVTIINTPMGKEFQAYPIALACIITSLGMIFLMEYIVKSVKNRLENQNLKLEYSYYKELEENQLEIRKIRHDMNNHLSIIASFIEDNNIDSAREYFTELCDKFKVSNRQFCKNSIVNAVINSKYNLAIENQVDCFFNVDIDAILPIDDIDLCSMFANTLDNAIEASQKIDKSQRKISVKARCDKGYFSYSITNNSGFIKKINGKYISDKVDKKMHGFGLENISDIAKKYNGTLNITNSDLEFCVLIIIKIS